MAQDISLKELLLTIDVYLQEIRRRWKIIVLLTLLSGTGTLLNAFLTKPTYTAKTTFVVREDSGNALGAVSGILGQFGLGAGATSEYNLDKISELARSRYIIQQVIMTKVSIEGKKDFLGNHIIDIYDLPNENWGDDKLLKSFRFTHDSIPKFSEAENKALQYLHRFIATNIRNRLMNVGYSKETSILFVNVTTINQYLSIEIAQNVYHHLSTFYVIQSTAQPRQTVKNLEFRADSVRTILYSAERRLARTEDRSLGTLLREDKVPAAHLGKDIQILTLMYGEVLKNLETASFLLKNATPFFMQIDHPIAPIIPDKASKIKSILVGFLIGFLLSIFIIVGRKIWGDAIKDN
jgi:uncharacterized protein involved in exopolysaccharide biosynthesis